MDKKVIQEVNSSFCKKHPKLCVAGQWGIAGAITLGGLLYIQGNKKKQFRANVANDYLDGRLTDDELRRTLAFTPEEVEKLIKLKHNNVQERIEGNEGQELTESETIDFKSKFCKKNRGLCLWLSQLLVV